MSLTTRCYIFAEDGALKRVPRRILTNLICGQDGIPEYTNTRQRIGTALIRLDGTKPAALLDIEGTFWNFDEHGRIDKHLSERLTEVLSLRFETKRPTGKVVDLTPVIRKRDQMARRRWEPTKEDYDRVAADLWPGINGAAEDVSFVKGKAPKRPPLTWEAKELLRKIESKFDEIRFALEGLSEPALKGLAFELRRTGTFERDGSMYEGVAAQCDRVRDLKARDRTGRGIWFAVIRTYTTYPGEVGAREHVQAYEKCANKGDAVSAARRLLKEHADAFGPENTVEASIQSELEWSPDEEE